jgi:hypothetical protein
MEKIVITILGDGPDAKRTFFDIVEIFYGPAVKRTIVIDNSKGGSTAFLISADRDVEVNLAKP